MGRYREIQGHAGPYFTTWAIVDWHPVFSRRDAFDAVIGCFKYCREQKGLSLHAYAIMPTHVHLIASATEDAQFSALVRDMKSFTSHKIVDLCKGGDRGHFLHVFRDHADVGQEQQGLAGGISPQGNRRP